MNTLIAMSSAWALITVIFAILLIYRRSLTKRESAWIPLTDDAKEESAIQAQTIIEMKTRKLTIPIRALRMPLAGHAAGHCRLLAVPHAVYSSPDAAIRGGGGRI